MITVTASFTIQREDGATEAGSLKRGGGGLGCLREHFQRFEGGLIKIRQPKAKRGYFIKFLSLKIHFFWQKDNFMHEFFNFENDNGNVTIEKEERETKL